MPYDPHSEPTHYAPPGAHPVEPAQVTSDEKTLAMLAHLLVLVAGFVGPLVIYLVKKDESRFVGEHARDALNFQITVVLAALCCIPLVFVLIGIPLIFAVSIGSLVCTILAAVEASKGNFYRYPFCLRLI
ncbi:MAG: DUF4870 domain-containing protein [Planctomycetota bacterium]